jgi:hypothetical protein
MGLIGEAAHIAERTGRDALMAARIAERTARHRAQGLAAAERTRANAERGVAMARRMPGTVAVLDGQVVQRRACGQAPKPIDGALVLGLVRRYLAHYVSWPSDAALTTAVAWIAHAVARDRDDKGLGQLIWRASPRLLVTSRHRGSGKSTLLDLIVILTGSRDGKIPKITPRAIAETTGQLFETVVLDEAKTLFGSGAKNLELQGILLAGYTPRTSYRVKGKSIALFGAVAYAGKDELITNTEGGQIGDLLDRSIKLRFRASATVTHEVDEIAEDDGELLASALVAWTDSVRAELRQAARDLATEDREASEAAVAAGQDAGNLRSFQIWRPLRAIARIADGPDEEGVYGPRKDGTIGAWEESVNAAAAELNAGAAAVEAQEALDELQRRAEAWGPGGADEDEPGEIVTEEDDYSDYEEEELWPRQ